MRRGLLLKVCIGAGAAILLFFLFLIFKTPSGDREWLSDLARLPGVHVEDDHTVTVAAVRDWRIAEDGAIEENYRARTFDTDDLERVWFFVQMPPGGKYFAHTFFSFDFKGQEPVVISVEARRETDEAAYSGFKGLFRGYELIYVWATEEDSVKAPVITYDLALSMYPLTISKEGAARLFMALATRSETTEKTPRFYNTIANNCTNVLADAANETKPGAVPWSFARIATGYADDYLIELGYIPPAAVNHADITATARAASNQALSAKIRAHVLQ